MPVELNLVESVTELDTTVVTVVLESASEPGPAGPGVPTGGTAGQVLTKDSGTDYDTSWQDAAGGPGGGAPDDATYLVTVAHDDLSAEVVVGATPGGELGGTWASPTVDASHSGSTHAAVQAAAEATAAAALASHEGDTTSIHGIADTSALALTASHPTNATFNDHSARHENGGADEISLAGLDGTPTELTNHLNDTSAAHAASAISADSTTLVGTGTDVQAVLEELDNGIADHLADSSAAHAASAISADSTTLVGTGTDVQAVLEELDNGIADHLADATDAHAGTAITNTPAGNVAATTVQAAINELDSEKTTAAAALTAAQTEIADQKRVMEILVTDPNGSAITTGDGKAYAVVPALMNGHNLVAAHAAVTTVSSSGTPTIQVNNTTQTADMLTTRITIDANEKTSYTAATPPVIDTGNDDVATGDELRIDIDVAGTGAKGLIVILTFEAP